MAIGFIWNEVTSRYFDQRSDLDCVTDSCCRFLQVVMNTKGIIQDVKLAPMVAAATIVILISFMPTFTCHGNAEMKVPVITIHARRYLFSPSTITLKQGQKVRLVFISDDVAHGVVVEGLGIDLNIEKSHSNQATITPLEVGDFEGKCSRYCGAGHNIMTFVVHVTR